MEAADMLPFEQVHVLDVDNGARLTTYAIEGARGSGQICINGAAARLVEPRRHRHHPHLQDGDGRRGARASSRRWSTSTSATASPASATHIEPRRRVAYGIRDGGTHMARITTTDIRDMKKRGEKIVMMTAYDYPSARLVEEGGADMILVGDTLGMVVLGYDSTRAGDDGGHDPSHEGRRARQRSARWSSATCRS